MEKVVIINAKRTPIGKLNGALKSKTAVSLATDVSKALIDKSGILTSDIDQVIFGNAIQAGNGQNIARQIELKSGLSSKTTAYTINQVCGSGLKAIRQAQLELLIGGARVIIAGGTESMSNVPFLNMNQRQPIKFGSITVYDGLEHDGLTDAFSNLPMGITAENVAKTYNISREQQDNFALNSHLKAQAAIRNHYFDDELIPIQITNKKKTTLVSQDEAVRFDTSLAQLAKLRPSFKETGTVTAGNAAGLNDGASALMMTTADHARQLGVTPLAEIVDYAEQGIDPNIMGYAPYYAIKKLLKQRKMQPEDIDLFEINEAFASQSIAVARDLHIPEDRLNINGGAIALGHPLGDSGARIVTTLIHNLKRTGKTYGIASLCMGGGMGSAMLLKKYG